MAQGLLAFCGAAFFSNFRVVFFFFFAFWGRKINFANSKTLVGRCRDRQSRALPLTCPNVKNLVFFRKNKNFFFKKMKSEKKRKQKNKEENEKKRKKNEEKWKNDLFLKKQKIKNMKKHNFFFKKKR